MQPQQESGALSTLKTVVSDEIKLPSVSKEYSVERRLKILRPADGGGTYSSRTNNVIRFPMPRENIDMRRSFLRLTITLSQTGGTYIRLPQYAGTCISRIRTVFNGFETDQQYVNRLMNFHNNTGMDADVISTIGQDFLGYGTKANRNAKGADPSGTDYVLLVRSGILSMDVLPFQALFCGTKDRPRPISNNALTFVEMTIADPLGVVECDGTNPLITVTNPEWHYTQYFGDAYSNMLYDIISSGGWTMGFRDWEVFQMPITGLANDLQVFWKGSSLNGIVTILVDTSSTNDPTVNDKFTTWLKTAANGATVINYSYNVNNQWYPEEAIDCRGNASRAYENYLLWEGIWDAKGYMKFGASVSLDDFNDDQFMMIHNAQGVPRDVWKLQTQDLKFSRVDTLNNNTPTLIRVNMSAAPSANLFAYIYVAFNTAVTLSSNGVFNKIV